MNGFRFNFRWWPFCAIPGWGGATGRRCRRWSGQIWCPTLAPPCGSFCVYPWCRPSKSTSHFISIDWERSNLNSIQLLEFSNFDLINLKDFEGFLRDFWGIYEEFLRYSWRILGKFRSNYFNWTTSFIWIFSNFDLIN